MRGRSELFLENTLRCSSGRCTATRIWLSSSENVQFNKAGVAVFITGKHVEGIAFLRRELL